MFRKLILMFVYFKNSVSVFVLLFCLANWPIGIKAIDNTAREKELFLPKLNLSTQEKGTDNKAHLKNDGLMENEETRKFRKEIDNLAKEFEGFESLSSQQQRCLLDKRKNMIKNYVAQANFARHGMMDGRFVVSDETWEKLRELHNLYLEEKNHCVIF